MATIFSQTIDANDTGWGDASHRVVVKVSSNALDQVRITLQGNSASGFSADNVAIGISATTDQTESADNLISTTATPVPVLFGNLPNVSASDGTQKVSDWANLTGFTTSNFLVVIIDYNATSNDGFHATGVNFNAGGPGMVAFKFSTNSTGTQTVSGFTAFQQQVHMLVSIETQSSAVVDTTTLIQSVISHVGSRAKPMGY